eukprot:TRINITY_DN805_c0_g1_i1.p1 TRINITY_DN805_c0_g1~~TRINITY_DN805_c0_g1_i1.p1  ORF type:complete len:197 (-),score=26.32 TRINITY_DN805_c0_g1_i1:33-623(-)
MNTTIILLLCTIIFLTVNGDWFAYMVNPYVICPYSFKTFSGSYNESALFLSSTAREWNVPDLIFETGSFDASANTNVGVISALGVVDLNGKNMRELSNLAKVWTSRSPPLVVGESYYVSTNRIGVSASDFAFTVISMSADKKSVEIELGMFSHYVHGNDGTDSAAFSPAQSSKTKLVRTNNLQDCELITVDFYFNH